MPGYAAAIISSPGTRGRPRFDVTKEQLEYLRSMSFTWTDIGNILGVSQMTLYRRRRDYGLDSEPTNPSSDADLSCVLSEMRVQFPTMGVSMVLGRLRSLGYFITRSRVRHAIRSTDPINSAMRNLPAEAVHHPYSVPGPNSLWHIGL